METKNPFKGHFRFLAKEEDFSFLPALINLFSFRDFFQSFGIFLVQLSIFVLSKVHFSFLEFEERKDILVNFLYRQRGRNVGKFIHSSMAGLTFFGLMIAPVIAEEFPGRSLDPWSDTASSYILSSQDFEPQMSTLVSEKPRDKIVKYTVSPNDTVSSIAEKFGVSVETILWQNNLGKNSKIKPGDVLEILPVSGVSHKVQKGDTVYSIAKKYDSSPQAIVDFPFNTFVNDETFELAIGQIIIVPDGVKPQEIPTTPRVRQMTPDAGTVVASGNFVWPASGTITQRFVWYHKGIDIANKSAPNILAADAGVVVIAGWPDSSGYGNRVIIDHQNGYKTLYAHLSAIFVNPGQTVKRGDVIGKMGSTGRSTGTHLHFEIIKDGSYLNPLSILR